MEEKRDWNHVMKSLYEDKLIRNDTSSVEHSISMAIRRAAALGDDTALMRIISTVQGLADTATRSKDSVLMKAVGRLHAQLRETQGGPKTYQPIMETKDCSCPITTRSSARAAGLPRSGKFKVYGYGSIFGGDPDCVGDIIMPGAFSRSLARHRAAGTLPKMFHMHSRGALAGIWTAMREDERGLIVEGQLASGVQLGRECNELIELGALDALSIGYFVPEGGATYKDGIRILSEISLREVSLVSLGCNPSALISNRSGTSMLADNLGEKVTAELENLKRLLAQDEAMSNARRSGTLIDFPSLEPNDEHEALISLNRTLQQISRSH